MLKTGGLFLPMGQRILVLETGGLILPAWQTKEDHSVEDIEGSFSQHGRPKRIIVLKTGGLFLPV